MLCASAMPASQPALIAVRIDSLPAITDSGALSRMRSASDCARARTAVDAYRDGRHAVDDRVLAEQNHLSASGTFAQSHLTSLGREQRSRHRSLRTSAFTARNFGAECSDVAATTEI